MTIRPWKDIKTRLYEDSVIIFLFIMAIYGFFVLIGGGAGWVVFLDEGAVHSVVIEFLRLSWYFWIPFLLFIWLYSVVRK